MTYLTFTFVSSSDFLPNRINVAKDNMFRNIFLLCFRMFRILMKFSTLYCIIIQVIDLNARLD